jgi:hypothetical protein
VTEFFNYLVVDPGQSQLNEIMSEYENHQTQEIMNKGDFVEGFKIML